MPTLHVAASRLARTLCIALSTAFAALLLAAAIGTANASAATTMPAQGIFEDCSLDTSLQTCIQRLQVMHDGGLQVVVFPVQDGSLANLTAYASAAHNLGMGVMWATSQTAWWDGSNVSSSFPAFSSACGCTDNASLLSYMIHFFSQQAGTYGYYAADDSMLSTGDQAGVARYVATIKAIDPGHTVLLSSNQESQAAQYQSVGDMNGAEIYPVTTDSLLPIGDNQGMWDGVGQTVTDTQHAADAAHKASAFILQAFTWGDNTDDGQAIGACTATDTKQSCYGKLQYPTGAAQLQLRNEVLKNAHPKLILWWSFQGTYGDASGNTYSIFPTGQVAASRWAGLSAAIKAPAPDAGTASATTASATTHTTHKTSRKHSRKRTRKATRHSARKTTRHTARKPTRKV